MRALREPDAFPSSDLGLLRALKLTSTSELEKRSQAWRPWRAYAAMYLWGGAGEPKARGAGEFASIATHRWRKRGGDESTIAIAR